MTLVADGLGLTGLTQAVQYMDRVDVVLAEGPDISVDTSEIVVEVDEGAVVGSSVDIEVSADGPDIVVGVDDTDIEVET